jgi:regulator of RNase E activity RraA
MDQHEIQDRFAALTTAHIADACIRERVPLRCGPAELRPADPGCRLAGRALPARHAGSVDIFLEALEAASAGDVLVADNGGRLDEACIGDLVALEAQAAGLSGIVIWGLHRDAADIRKIGLPVFSLGTIPAGPEQPRARAEDPLGSAALGNWAVTQADLVLGDDDGVILVPAGRAPDVFSVAETIRNTERHQAAQIRAGTSLRAQLRFAGYLERRQQEPGLTFRDHLRSEGGAIEE